MTAPLIALENVSKYFGTVIALKDVSFDLRQGEVHCLLGDNGAGKSTLIKVLSGVHRPDGGTISVGGEKRSFASPRETLDRGIATVYQDLALVPLMSVARNFFLGREPVGGSDSSGSSTSNMPTAPLIANCATWGSNSAMPSSRSARLSGGERQCLAIARAIHFGAKVLILDEPTSALGVHQAAIVLKLIVQSKARGIGVIFISHNVHHAYVVGDRFTILKRGKSAGTYAKSDISRDQLLNLMAGGKELVDLEAEITKLKIRNASGK